MDYGSLFGAVGSIAGAFIQSNATQNATAAQLRALEQARQFVYSNLDPASINQLATTTDIQNINQRLALQAQIDPALAGIRSTAQTRLADQLGTLGQPGDAVAAQATAEALPGVPGMNAAKGALVQSALEQLRLGATLPPDVQNELVQAGLEQSGMVTQSASGKGMGGQMLRTILGSAGLQLKARREAAAQSLLQSASGLETQRQSILQQLFPNLTAQQLNVMGGTSGTLSASNAMLPNAGLTGSQATNVALSRVGAVNQLSQSAADTSARGSMASGQIWGNALGGGLQSLGQSGLFGMNTQQPSAATRAEVQRSILAGPQTMG